VTSVDQNGLQKKQKTGASVMTDCDNCGNKIRSKLGGNYCATCIMDGELHD